MFFYQSELELITSLYGETSLESIGVGVKSATETYRLWHIYVSGKVEIVSGESWIPPHGGTVRAHALSG